MTLKRIHVIVSGAVQGVGYRWFSRERGRALGLAGWVRNLENGDVDLMIEGASDKVDAFVESLRKGPSRSRVDTLQVRDAPAHVRLETPFDIGR